MEYWTPATPMGWLRFFWFGVRCILVAGAVDWLERRCIALRFDFGRRLVHFEFAPLARGRVVFSVLWRLLLGSGIWFAIMAVFLTLLMEKIVKTDAEWRAGLDEEAFRVTRRGGTERPFTGKYHDCKTAGMYKCICCDAPLFASEAKFDSGTGWPSFHSPAAGDAVAERSDFSLLMRRTEVLCARCDAHLGHVFPDGPRPSGLRYCINSAALTLAAGDN